MTKLKNKYVIGCHVMFYEIEIYKEYIEGLINLLETVDNKENIDADNYFLLAARAWNNQTEDYTTIEDSETSLKYFKNYPDAEELYQEGGLSVFPYLKGKDIKLDLIHVRFGVNRLVLSRIVV